VKVSLFRINADLSGKDKVLYALFYLMCVTILMRNVFINTNIFMYLQGISLLLIGGYALSFMKYFSDYYFYKFLLLLYVVFMMFEGVDNYYIYYISDLSKYSLIFILFYFLRYNNQKYNYVKLINLLVDFLYFAVPITIYLILVSGMKPAMAYDERLVLENGAAFNGDPAFLVKYSIFLVPFYSLLNRSKRNIVILSVLLVFVIGLMIVGRGLIVLSTIGLLYFMMTEFKVLSYRKIVFSLFLIMVLSVIFLMNYDDLNKLFGFFIYRSSEMVDFTTGRDVERDVYLQSINKFTFFFGSGLGGANKTWIWKDMTNGMSMMHYGYMYQMLKGGLLWVVLFYLMIFLSIKEMIKSDDSVSKMSLYSLILMIVYEMSHTLWANPVQIYFQMLVISYGLISGKIVKGS